MSKLIEIYVETYIERIRKMQLVLMKAIADLEEIKMILWDCKMREREQ